MTRLGMVIAIVLAAAGAAAEEARRQISVTGEGLVTAAPDMATITLGASFEAREARAAVAAVSQAVAGTLDSLKALGVEPRDLQTRHLSLSPLLDDRGSYSGGPRKVAGFHASNSVLVRVRDLAALGGILDGILEAGANQFGGLRFSVQDPAPLMEAARRKAVADAMARAAVLADAAGVTLGEVISINDQGGGLGGMEMATARRGGSVPIAEGEISVRVSVSVVFAIGG